MTDTKKKSPSVIALETIEKAVYAAIKPLGFTKHGRTLHRFVSGDISQVINFQLGQAYLDATGILSVNIGIRVPECMLLSFEPESPLRKYYHEYDCNLRAKLGETDGEESVGYDLSQPVEPIISDILRRLNCRVIPAFDILISREAILEKRRDYPDFDRLNRHLILREEAMIYGRLGDIHNAHKMYNQYLSELLDRVPSAPANSLVRRFSVNGIKPTVINKPPIEHAWIQHAVDTANALNLELSEQNLQHINKIFNT